MKKGPMMWLWHGHLLGLILACKFSSVQCIRPMWTESALTLATDHQEVKFDAAAPAAKKEPKNVEASCTSPPKESTAASEHMYANVSDAALLTVSISRKTEGRRIPLAETQKLVQNASNCYSKCNKTQGPCDWCDNGYLCCNTIPEDRIAHALETNPPNACLDAILPYHTREGGKEEYFVCVAKLEKSGTLRIDRAVAENGEQSLDQKVVVERLASYAQSWLDKGYESVELVWLEKDGYAYRKSESNKRLKISPNGIRPEFIDYFVFFKIPSNGQYSVILATHFLSKPSSVNLTSGEVVQDFVQHEAASQTDYKVVPATTCKDMTCPKGRHPFEEGQAKLKLCFNCEDSWCCRGCEYFEKLCVDAKKIVVPDKVCEGETCTVDECCVDRPTCGDFDQCKKEKLVANDPKQQCSSKSCTLPECCVRSEEK